jgi:hypothetical protein
MYARWDVLPCAACRARSPLKHRRCLPLQLLLLGFGDVRNVLATAAACAAERGSRCRELAFDLCDIGLPNVARGVLLLHLVGRAWRRDPCWGAVTQSGTGIPNIHGRF